MKLKNAPFTLALTAWCLVTCNALAETSSASGARYQPVVLQTASIKPEATGQGLKLPDVLRRVAGRHSMVPYGLDIVSSRNQMAGVSTVSLRGGFTSLSRRVGAGVELTVVW